MQIGLGLMRRASESVPFPGGNRAEAKFDSRWMALCVGSEQSGKSVRACTCSRPAAQASPTFPDSRARSLILHRHKRIAAWPPCQRRIHFRIGSNDDPRAHFNQIIIRIAHVDAQDRTDGAGALDGTLDDRDTLLLKMFLRDPRPTRVSLFWWVAESKMA